MKIYSVIKNYACLRIKSKEEKKLNYITVLFLLLLDPKKRINEIRRRKKDKNDWNILYVLCVVLEKKNLLSVEDKIALREQRWKGIIFLALWKSLVEIICM